VQRLCYAGYDVATFHRRTIPCIQRLVPCEGSSGQAGATATGSPQLYQESA
jgi:hypothetical protein